MKLIICVLLILTACKQPSLKEEKTVMTDTTSASITESQTNDNDSIKKNLADDIPKSQMPIQFFALTSNALQIVNGKTGSTSEIAFGKPLDELVEITNKILQDKVYSIGINNECGAGPLKMALWKNGLNLIFKEQKSNGLWQFVGWYIGKSTTNSKPLQTMAGIGIGSTKAEMEKAYVIKVIRSSLGYEFSTTSGLYGIFDGSGKNAKITDIWSGTTCVFR